jgi:tRNA-2-methylthio-N6-dimethylallyladenosine synthase
MADHVPKHVVQERFDRLVALQDEIAWAENRAFEGRTVEVLAAPGEGRKDAATDRMSGRARDNRLVHFAVPAAARERGEVPRPGDMATVQVTYGAPHHLVADGALAGGPYAVRRTRGGDAWEATQDHPTDAPTGGPAVSLGLPRVGAPPPRP